MESKKERNREQQSVTKTIPKKTGKLPNGREKVKIIDKEKRGRRGPEKSKTQNEEKTKGKIS